MAIENKSKRYRVDLPCEVSKHYESLAKQAGVSTPTVLKIALAKNVKKEDDSND